MVLDSASFFHFCKVLSSSGGDHITTQCSIEKVIKVLLFSNLDLVSFLVNEI